MAGVDMSGHEPPGLTQAVCEAAGGFFGITPALRRPDDDPGDLGGPGSRAARAGRVAWTVPTALPVLRWRITQLPQRWSPLGEWRLARVA